MSRHEGWDDPRLWLEIDARVSRASHVVEVQTSRAPWLKTPRDPEPETLWVDLGEPVG